MTRAKDRVRDVVCGMEISPAEAATRIEQGGQTYYFCSEACAERFRANLERYASPEQAEQALASARGGVPYLAVGPAEAERPVPSATTGVPEGARVVRVEFPIERLDCAECARRVQQALAALPGVQFAFVNPESRVATVAYDRSVVGLPDMAGVVRQAGYLVGSNVERIGIAGMT